MFRRCVSSLGPIVAAGMPDVQKLSIKDCQVPISELSQEELYRRFLTMRWFDAPKKKSPIKKLDDAVAQAGKKQNVVEQNVRPATGLTLFLASNRGSPVFKELARRQCSPMAAWAKLPAKEKALWRERAKHHVGFATKLQKQKLRMPAPRPKGRTAYNLFLEEISRDPRFLAIKLPLRFKVLGQLWRRQKEKIAREQEELEKAGNLPAIIPPKKELKRMKTYKTMGIDNLLSQSKDAIRFRKARADKKVQKKSAAGKRSSKH